MLKTQRTPPRKVVIGSDPAIWAGGLPIAGARIHIESGHEVTVDAKIPSTFMTIRVDGTLRFAIDVDTELRVDLSAFYLALEFLRLDRRIPRGYSF